MKQILPSELSKYAYKITSSKLEPFHYKKMFKEITGKDKIENGNTDYVENFRNWIDYNDNKFQRLNSGWFTLKEWLDNKQKRLYCEKPISIDWKMEVTIDSLDEIKQRLPYLKDKYKDGPVEHMIKFLKGKIPEQHIKDFFKLKYPQNYISPNNDIKTPDTFDFALKFNDKLIRFDAKSLSINKYDGEMCMWLEESRINESDYYLPHKSNGDCKVYGYVSTNDICTPIYSKNYCKYYRLYKCKNWHDIKFMFIYLNHLKYGFDLKEILKNGFLWRN